MEPATLIPIHLPLVSEGLAGGGLGRVGLRVIGGVVHLERHDNGGVTGRNRGGREGTGEREFESIEWGIREVVSGGSSRVRGAFSVREGRWGGC